MRTCQPCPEIYPWTGKTGIRSSRVDNDIEEQNCSLNKEEIRENTHIEKKK